MRREHAATFVVLGSLAAVHLVATGGGAQPLPTWAREAFGASAATTFSRPGAFFAAPFFHSSWGHLLYNSLLLGVALPSVLRRFGVARGLLLVYLASPLVGVLVNVLFIRPLAFSGVEYAVAAAPVRLIGASVVAFATVGAALASGPLRSWRGRAGAFVLLAAYEATLELLGVTQPFIATYHLGGLLIGLVAGAARAPVGPVTRPAPRRPDP